MKMNPLLSKARAARKTGRKGAVSSASARYGVSEPSRPPSDGARVSLELVRRTKTDLLTFAKTHIECMAGNPVFPVPQPPEEEFQYLVNLYEAKMIAADMARDAAKLATTEFDDVRVALERAFITRGGYVQMESHGNTAVIESAGLPVRAGRTPVGILPVPDNLKVELNGVAGVMALSWNRVKNARSYIVEVSEAPGTERNWKLLKTASDRKVTVPDLTLGMTYAFRIAAVGGSAGQSAFCPEVIRMAA